MSHTIAIIGGGAAGMMAAASILETAPDSRIILCEKNPGLGRKVIISGGGRCNVTTGIHDVRELIASKYIRGGKFLTNALYNFPPTAVYEWFEDHGVPLKTEADLRVFPQSDNGEDIVNVFRRLFADSGVDVRLKTGVEAVTKTASGFMLQLKDGEELQADKLILTTGGQAYRHTGSTGDGYAFAESLGHSVTTLAASLNSFIASDDWASQLPGVALEWVGLQSSRDTQHLAEGPIVFTHKGISGPAVFALSAQIAFEDYTRDNPLTITLDFVTQLNVDQLVERLAAEASNNPKQLLLKTVAAYVPKSLAEICLQQNQVDVRLQNANVGKKQLRAVAEWLKKCPLNLTGRGAGSEFVTAGGVELSEVDPRTMESLIMPGLYFAGELLNVDGVTGGFNLQASWAAGRLAGQSAAL